ncbi:WhiB family transcriptional regulator [Micromonospora sp. MED01]|uniref:WhiB family transcriptional regulator n=1 Tax=Micromonospora alfalfae TaxID=2911212 RepID=UPI001EE9006D|nr:WhiB family transcriptional regulator [Micromonospora alfalfae]MCG5460815.1 WhiB family transcriptional regulator [Micromonospora alfalfae]
MRNDTPLTAADLLGNVGDWQEQALCTQTDPEVFYPEKGGTVEPAKKVCRNCDVQAECLEYALNRDERFGVWGGLSEKERRAEAKRRAGRAPAVAA